ETIGRVMPEIVIRQLWILPCFADINGNPATICQELSPAMVAVDRALVFVSGNSSADGKARRDADAARQCNEIGMEISAVAGVHIAGIHGVTTAPASA